jgi:hypothetical protein
MASTPAGPVHQAGPSSAALLAAASPTQEIQLADEIIRRLRRLGLNFNRARIARPYDPAGELC